MRRSGSQSDRPHVHVVAAALSRGDGFLLGRRPDGSNMAGHWEFPGGKVRDGESREEALAREIREELALAVRVGDHLATAEHSYPHLNITLHLYSCTIAAGDPVSLFHAEIGWFSTEEMRSIDLAPSNRGFVDAL